MQFKKIALNTGAIFPTSVFFGQAESDEPPSTAGVKIPKDYNFQCF
jgi:hypothetical protein